MDGIISFSDLFMRKETLAVFDFDGTLTTRDTFIEFIKFSKGVASCYTGLLIFSPLLIAMTLHLYPNWKVKQRIFSYFFKDATLVDFDKWGTKFSREISKIIRPQALEAMRMHHAKGDKVLIISASIENWIIPWAEKMDISVTLATKVEIDAKGMLTGNFLTKNCNGLEKVKRLLEVYPNRDIYNLVAYGDSPGDKELLQAADQGFYRKFK